MKNTDTPEIESPVVPERTERRYVYNGGAPRPDYENVQRGNRPVRKRKRSPFNVVVILFAIAIGIVLYIWNKISVDHLNVEVAEYNAQYERILLANQNLAGEVGKKSTRERIGGIATAQLGMIQPVSQPTWFTFDDRPLSRLDQQ